MSPTPDGPLGPGSQAPAQRVLPVVDDPDTAGFWAAAARGELAVCHCAGCGAVLHLPLPRCPACRSSERAWRVVPPIAELYSWSVVTRAVHPSFSSPYTVVLVELPGTDPPVRFVGDIEGAPALHAGMTMHAVFDDAGGGVVIPRWLPGPPETPTTSVAGVSGRDVADEFGRAPDATPAFRGEPGAGGAATVATPRLALADPDGDDATARALLGPDGEFPALADVNLFRALARHPGMMRKFAPFGMKVLHGGKLPARERELLVLRTAARCGSGYEWAHHVAIGAEAGLTDEEIERVAGFAPGGADAGWSDHDRALLDAVDELHDVHCVRDPTWAQLATRYTDAQLLEVVVVVGTYQLVAGVLNSVRVPLEPGTTAGGIAALIGDGRVEHLS